MKKLKRLRRQLLLQYLLTVGLLLVGAELSLYVLFGWAGQRELDTALRKDIETLASTIEIEADGSIEFEGELAEYGEHEAGSGELRLPDRMSTWQILLEDGSTLARARNAVDPSADLPAVGGQELPLDELRFADGGSRIVRYARLRTVRRRLERGGTTENASPAIMFDIRAAVDRRGLDEQLRSLAWYLVGGFPILLGFAAVAGYYLIRRAVRPVEEAFGRERRFTGAASHELRTPLTALRGEIDVALRHPRSTAEYQEALERMGALAARMTGLVEGLLVLARADAGHLLCEASEVSVAALEDALREVTRQLPDHQRLTITCTAPPTMKVLGDSLLLAIAVRNLVENSLTYAIQGDVHLRIDSPADNLLEMSVADQGPGIPPEVLSTLDKRVSTNGIPRHGRNGGTGLGLSITQAVVESHGGEFCLRNGANSGSVAIVWLPALAPDHTDLTAHAAETSGNRSVNEDAH